MDSANKRDFGTLRSIFWPVYASEMKQVITTFVLLFLVCSCYSILRNIKDTVFLSHVGAEVLPFVKVWGMLPGVFLAMSFYSFLASRFSREHVVYIIVSFYLLYFLFFSFVLYPINSLLTLQIVSSETLLLLPKGVSLFVKMLQQWNITLFYVVVELWAPIVLAVLFWGLVNEMTRFEQATRFYGLLNIGSNLAPAIGIYLGRFIINHMGCDVCLFPTEGWGLTLNRTMILITGVGLCALFVFSRLIRIQNKLNLSSTQTVSSRKKKKIKLSVIDSLSFISKDRYLICLALIVIAYNMAINFSDVLWKSQLSLLFTNRADMNVHLDNISIFIGVLSTILALLFSFFISRYGWVFTAVMTPLVMGLFSLLFFSSLFFESKSLWVASLAGVSPLALSVYLGSLQNALEKSGKYSIFDASKEIAFLSFNKEARIKGKASIDGLGSGLGKSGSSIIYQVLLLFFGSISACSPYIFVLLFIVILMWLIAVKIGGKQFGSQK